MPRLLRVPVEGGIYHVHSRLVRGAKLFGDQEEAVEYLGVGPESLAGREKGRRISRARYLIAALGIEHWGMEAKALAEPLGRWPGAVSRWAGRGAEMRMKSADFREDRERLDHAIASANEPDIRDNTKR